jgi:sugar/nucleoside kinase (ribokinase family)
LSLDQLSKGHEDGMAKRYDLIVIGDLVADIIMPVRTLPLRPNEHDWADGIFTELGGACNTLVAARRVNLKTVALGMVGADDYGEQVLGMLADEGVVVEHAVALPGRQTVLCVVVTDKVGQHVFLGIKDHEPPERCPAAWRDVVPLTRVLFTNGYTLLDVLHPGDVMDLLRLGRDAGIPVFFDPGPSIEFIDRETLKQVLALTDVLVLTAEEAAFLVDETGFAAADALRAFGPDVVVLKAGAEGCYVVGGEERIHHPGFVVDVVDTVGAGDSFVSALIAGYVRGGDWRECAALANAMGAAVVATQGAGRCVPGADALRALLDGDPAARLLDDDAPGVEPN